MKRLILDGQWPDTWKSAYQYDQEEVYGQITNAGYAYAYQTRYQQTLQLITDVLPRGASILDIAAAQGNFSLLLAERGYDVTWNDLRAELIGYVQKKHEHGKIAFAPGNALELEFGSLFDAVLITEVIEHVAHPDNFLMKVAQFVRPGGYVIMTTPNGSYIKNRLPRFSECPDPSIYEGVQFAPDSDGHIFLLHPQEIPALAEHAGLAIDEFRLFTNPLTNGHLKLGVLLHILPRGLVSWLEKLTQHLPRVLRNRILIQMGVRFQRIAPLQCGVPGKERASVHA